MQGQTHRKPGPPMRNFGEHLLETADREAMDQWAIRDTVTEHTLTPKPEDAERMGQKRTSPIQPR
ncbi:hypothetical protein [Alicyclobacillus vulcanalis]|uniref:Uncharacterized protein n=1 Tax=Alicyclobacillus vulcanalis TaxID=252246 RepID=A0A1N7KTB8_9BACL|nr:hypothetical protein [Alicyclobacillus vulcanalis]SIS64839.1 hypothetical protein SAMN05421799_102172 [Alicyclobacillus vulcanalis]